MRRHDGVGRRVSLLVVQLLRRRLHRKYVQLMDAHQCRGCRQWWASNCGDADRFEYSTTWCPDCIAKIPTMILEPLTGPSWKGFTAKTLPIPENLRLADYAVDDIPETG